MIVFYHLFFAGKPGLEKVDDSDYDSGFEWREEVIGTKAKNFWLQDTPITALIRPVSLNDTICLQSCKMLFDSFRCDPYDFSEFPRRIVRMFLEDLDNPLPTFLLFLPTFYGFSYFLSHIFICKRMASDVTRSSIYRVEGKNRLYYL